MQPLSRFGKPKLWRTSGYVCLLVGVLSSFGIPSPLAAEESDASETQSVRIATFNVSLYGKHSGQVAQRLSDGQDQQAEKLAAVIQTVRPDVLLLNEVDHDTQDSVLNLFADRFLARAQQGHKPIDYPFRYGASSNTGVDSQLDLDGNGKRGGLADDWGFGHYEGQYAMALLSRFPIDVANLRSFQKFKWSDFPGALKPIVPKSGIPYYADEVWRALRLSSKNHIDVPIKVHGHVIHLLASHPTPPVFDGKEDRNGCRNHDEIRFWSLYVSSKQSAGFLDDQQRVGGLPEDQSFVIVGDLNSDPHRGDSKHEAIAGLLEHPRLQDPQPTCHQPSAESVLLQTSDPKQPAKVSLQTASFGKGREFRIDYVLPSRDLRVVRSGVYWPRLSHSGNKTARLAAESVKATDHRMVWIDVVLP